MRAADMFASAVIVQMRGLVGRREEARTLTVGCGMVVGWVEGGGGGGGGGMGVGACGVG